MAPHNSERPRRDRHHRRRLWANFRADVAWNLTRELRKRLLAGRDLVPCYFCGRPLDSEEATLWRKRIRMGPAVMESLKISCEPCNDERGVTGVETWPR
jgi:hypothetical protein